MTEKQINEKLLKYRQEVSDMHDMGENRIPIDFEKAVIRYVKEGKPPAELLKQYQAAQDATVNRGGMSFKEFEYATVAIITVCTRAAIEGGADPEYCYDLGEVLLLELQKARNENMIREIMKLSVVMFAKQVHSARKKNKPYQISQCRNYIDAHLFRRLTVAEVAQHVQLHPHYISQLFLEYEGYTLQDYIQKEKIDAACHALLLSNRPISEISQNLGYQSQSNFTVVFRKWQGMTPKEYRNLHHHAASEQTKT